MSDVVITEFMDEDSVAELRTEFEVLYDPRLAYRSDLAHVIRDARALVVRNQTRVDAALLAAAPQLRVVARLGAGLDNIDTAACERRGVEVATAAGANAPAVAEYVIGALLVLFRGVYGLTAPVIAGEWPRLSAVGEELNGKRLGLVGSGATAREVAARASSLGMSIAVHDPYLPVDDPDWQEFERLGLADLFATSHAISVHVPLTRETRGLVSRSLIGTLPTGSVLVNTSRGGVVDEEAVIEALRGGQLAGAALDVFETEPVTAESAEKFIGVPNLVLTPHVAGITRQSQQRIGQMTIAALRRALGDRS